MRNDKKLGRTTVKTPNKKAHLSVNEPAELMKFLLAQLPKKSRNNIKSLLTNKQVIVDGVPVKQFNHPLRTGQVVEIRWSRIPEEKQYRGISIIYEDQYMVVIDKHAGMLSIATDTKKSETAYNMLSRHVKQQGSGNKIFVVHRLDRETSGLMMFAKSEKVQQILQANWHELVTERTYLAVVEGKPKKPEGTITSYLHESKAFIVYSSQNPKDGQKAITHYKLKKAGEHFSMLTVNLDSGKKNQIRVHMQDLGHPVIGDKKYGSKTNPVRRLGLHSWILAFNHPINKEPLRFQTSIPAKFTRLF